MSATKLELTWPRKNNTNELEPRIFIEKPEFNYGDSDTGNMLIHGDNLLALKALEQEFSGKINCVYIDPPYNTGSAFEFYDDGLEHTVRLNLMYQRLKIIYNLLNEERGAIFIQLDDAEMHYCKVILDEIFGRNCFRECITVRTSTPSGVNAINVKRGERLFKVKEYILFYSKSPKYRFNPLYVKAPYNTNYRYEVIKNGNDYSVRDLKSIYKTDEELEEYCLKNPENIYSLEKNNKKAGEKIKAEIAKTVGNSRVIEFINSANKMVLVYGGGVLTSLNERIVNDGTANYFGTLISDLWDDELFQSNKTEGGVEFSNAKKPEKLIKRIIDLSTQPGDIVLDSFLGSGTTCAVAHKMNRRWIGIELGDQAYTHCKARLDSVIDGEQTGISQVVGWEGGGGYKFYELGPSVLKQDVFGNYIINPNFNSSELIQAICKIENFTYKAYDDNIKHGYSTEKDFIHVTTRHVTQDVIDDIQKTILQDGESMLIVAKTYEGNLDLPDNIQIKKIPLEILNKCEYDKDDYSLPISPEKDLDEEDE